MSEPAPDPSEKTRFLELPTQQVPPAAHEVYLVILTGAEMGRRFRLEGRELLIGRGPGVEIVLNDSSVSKKHARLSVTSGAVQIEDAGSTNGTFLNGTRLSSPASVQDGDRIQFGQTVCKVFLGDTDELRVYEAATKDGLTGALNKAAILARLEAEFRRHARYSAPLGLLVADLDYFKRVNDTWGHPAGDFVLKRAAAVIQAALRASDMLGRFGGEEFLAVLPETKRDAAAAIAERIRSSLEATEFSWKGNDATGKPGEWKIPVTASLGVAGTDEKPFESHDALLAAADARMYESKHGGRNRVTS